MMAMMKLADLPVTLLFPEEVVKIVGDPKIVRITGKQPGHLKGPGWAEFFSMSERWFHLPSYPEGKGGGHAIYVDMEPQNGYHRITATYEAWVTRGLDAATLAVYGEVVKTNIPHV